MNKHGGRPTITLGYKNTTLTLYSRKSLNLLWCKWDRRIQTAISTNNFFFSWPYHAVLSSRLHSSTSQSVGIQPEARCEPLGRTLPLQGAQPLTGGFSDWPNLFWLQAETDLRLAVSHVEILCIISKCSPCLFNHVTIPSYLHRCVLYREILDWRIGQGSICNMQPCWVFEIIY